MGKVATHPDSRVFLDQFELTRGFATAFQQSLKQETLDSGTIGDVGPRRIVGAYDHDHGDTNLFDGDDNKIDEILQGLLDDDLDHYLTHLFGANVEGSVSYDALVKLADRPHKGASGALIILETKFSGSGGLSRGLVLRNATITGIGAGTGRNQGTTPANATYAAVIRVLSGTFTTITVQVQESSDDGSVDPYALITGMSATLTAAGVQRVTTVAATEAWKRVNVSAFTGTSCVLVVTAGRVAGT